MIDGIRGIGAISIALYHIFRYGPLPLAADAVVPDPVRWCIDHGWIAVQFFLVISGFGAAYATLNQVLPIGAVRVYLVRRLIRLGGAYWATIALSTVLTAIAILALDDRSFNESLPTLGQIAAHIAFLQDIIDYENLTTGIWFLSIDLQFGVVFILLLKLAQSTAEQMSGDASRPGILPLAIWFGPLTLYSLFVSVRLSATEMWFHHFFCMPMLGAVVCWTVYGGLRPRVFWTYATLIQAQVIRVFVEEEVFMLEVALALMAGSIIYCAARLGTIETWLNNPLMQYLGRISYSLFLIHYPVSWVIGWIGVRLTGDQPWAALGWLLAELLASIGAAHLLYTHGEQPSLAWAKRVH